MGKSWEECFLLVCFWNVIRYYVISCSIGYTLLAMDSTFLVNFLWRKKM